MKKREAGSTRDTVITVEEILRFRRKKEMPTRVVVVDEETQKKFPRLLVSSTLTTQVLTGDNPGAIKNYRASEPKLIHDK